MGSLVRWRDPFLTDGGGGIESGSTEILRYLYERGSVAERARVQATITAAAETGSTSESSGLVTPEPPPPVANPLRTLFYANEVAAVPTAEQGEWIAAVYNYICENPGKLPRTAGGKDQWSREALRRIRPGIDMRSYINGPYWFDAYQGRTNPATGNTYNQDGLVGPLSPDPDRPAQALFARTSDGLYFRNETFTSLWLMRVNEFEWWRYQLAACRADMEITAPDGGWSGAFFDNMGLFPISPNQNTLWRLVGGKMECAETTATGKCAPTSVKPVRSGTTLWTETSWLGDQENFGVYIAERIAPKALSGNGLRWGTEYFDTPSTGIPFHPDGLRLMHAEGWLRHPTDTAYPSATKTLASINMLEDAGSKGFACAVHNKIENPESGAGAVTRAWKDAWHRFCLACFYLGQTSDAMHYFNLTYQRTVGTGFAGWNKLPASVEDVRHRYWRPEKNLGPPLGPKQRVTGTDLYWRQFQNGVAVVNAGTVAWPFSFPSSGTWVDLEGVTYGAGVSMPKTSGDVFIRQ